MNNAAELTFWSAILVAIIGVLGVWGGKVLDNRSARRTEQSKQETKSEISNELGAQVAVATEKATAAEAQVGGVLGLAQESTRASNLQTEAFLNTLEAHKKETAYYQNTIQYLMERNAGLQTTLDTKVSQFERELRVEREARESLEGRYEELEGKYKKSEQRYALREQAWGTAWDGMVAIISALPDGDSVKKKLPPRPNGLAASHTTRRKAIATKRDATRDAGRDEGRDLVRDPARDMARDIERDAEVDAEGGKS